MKLALIADDLTGAADSIAPFIGCGLRCSVMVWPKLDYNFRHDQTDALAISTETRDLDADERGTISSRIDDCLQLLVSLGIPPVLLLKIDSTLRGCPGLALQQLNRRFPERKAAICPAFPAQNRVVREGVLYVDSVFRSKVDDSFPPESGRYFDAVTDADLKARAIEILCNPEQWLPVGSAGLMSAIASTLYDDRDGKPGIPDATVKMSLPALFIIGTGHPSTLRQTSVLETGPNIGHFGSVSEALASNANMSAIVVGYGQQQEACQHLQNLLHGAEGLPESSYGTTVISGGATASALLDRLSGFELLEIRGQIEPGIVAAVVRFGSSTHRRPVDVILKSGGFGDEEALMRILSRLNS